MTQGQQARTTNNNNNKKARKGIPWTKEAVAPHSFEPFENWYGKARKQVLQALATSSSQVPALGSTDHSWLNFFSLYTLTPV